MPRAAETQIPWPFTHEKISHQWSASGSARAFYPESMKEMAAALTQVAGDLSAVRLTR